MASPRVSHKEEYPPRDGKKEILNRICRCVRIINTPSVAPNDRSDAAEVQPYASASRLGELRYPHQQCSETLHQYIGKARQQHSKLIGDEAKTACPVGKEIQLLLLDAVSHLPSCAIDIFIQIPSAAGEIGYRLIQSFISNDPHFELLLKQMTIDFFVSPCKHNTTNPAALDEHD